MKFMFMNLGHETAVIDISDDSLKRDTIPEKGFISDIEIIDSTYLPFRIKYMQNADITQGLEKWMLNRIIPEHRDGAGGLKKLMGDNFLLASLQRARFASLTDGYWVKGVNEDTSWDNINFFRNRFSYDLGNIGLGQNKDNPSLNSPDLSTNGQTKKTWRRRDGKLFLLKQGMYPEYEEPFNEKASTVILERYCKVPFVKYDIVSINGHICSTCESFLKEGQELVTAADLCAAFQRPDYLTPEEHLKDQCKVFGIPGYKEFLDNIRVLDYVIGNYDRHFGNIAFIYDTENKVFTGPAPIFDNGSSMWNNYVPMPPKETREQAVAQFKNNIKIIKPEKIDLKGLHDGIMEALEYVYSGSMVNPEKIKAISKLTETRALAAEECIEIAKSKKRDKEDIER